MTADCRARRTSIAKGTLATTQLTDMKRRRPMCSEARSHLSPPRNARNASLGDPMQPLTATSGPAPGLGCPPPRPSNCSCTTALWSEVCEGHRQFDNNPVAAQSSLRPPVPSTQSLDSLSCTTRSKLLLLSSPLHESLILPSALRPPLLFPRALPNVIRRLLSFLLSPVLVPGPCMSTNSS